MVDHGVESYTVQADGICSRDRHQPRSGNRRRRKAAEVNPESATVVSGVQVQAYRLT